MIYFVWVIGKWKGKVKENNYSSLTFWENVKGGALLSPLTLYFPGKCGYGSKKKKEKRNRFRRYSEKIYMGLSKQIQEDLEERWVVSVCLFVSLSLVFTLKGRKEERKIRNASSSQEREREKASFIFVVFLVRGTFSG